MKRKTLDNPCRKEISGKFVPKELESSRRRPLHDPKTRDIVFVGFFTANDPVCGYELSRIERGGSFEFAELDRPEKTTGGFTDTRPSRASQPSDFPVFATNTNRATRAFVRSRPRAQTIKNNESRLGDY